MKPLFTVSVHKLHQLTSLFHAGIIFIHLNAFSVSLRHFTLNNKRTSQIRSLLLRN